MYISIQFHFEFPRASITVNFQLYEEEMNVARALHSRSRNASCLICAELETGGGEEICSPILYLRFADNR